MNADRRKRGGECMNRKPKPVQSHTLAGMAQSVIAQELAAAEQAGEELTALMRDSNSSKSNGFTK